VILLAILGLVTLMVLGALLNGWALNLLWGWFLVPTLGLPDISIVEAIGISLVISFLTSNPTSSSSSSDDEDWSAIWGKVLGQTVGGPIFAVAVGWILHFFV